ncbi:MAG: hypothetical protein L0Y56_12850, partial [Nitrospira sp.]|nr:hypothetical protein [Nitrospira sp.]
MRTLKVSLLTLVLSILVATSVAEAAAKKVFLLDSYDATYAWNMSEQEAARQEGSEALTRRTREVDAYGVVRQAFGAVAAR